MDEMNVLGEILSWSVSQDLPLWQRDALRRIIVTGTLAENDIRELTDICEAKHGLRESIPADPLSDVHLPNTTTGHDAVLLRSLTHHGGVNALAFDQTLEFNPSLTIVYGSNGAGKSGYTRILKQACRARGAEEILGNVTSGTTPRVPSATFKCSIGDSEEVARWDGGDSPSQALGRISVFDHHCASVYVADKTDIAFRPLGLDVFGKLAEACVAVKKLIEKDRSELKSPSLPLVPDVGESTEVAKLVGRLTSLTDSETVKKYAALTEEEQKELVDLEKRMVDAAAASPAKAAKELETRASRVGAFLEQSKSIFGHLEDTTLQLIFDARDTYSNAIT